MTIKPSIYVYFLLNLLLLSACTPAQIKPNSSTGAPLRGTVDVQTSGDENGWQEVSPAMELRSGRLTAGDTIAHATMVRFDPTAYKVSVKYDVINAGTAREWFNALKPIALINGGYFDAAGRPTALVIFDGIARGESYQGFGGMLVINADGKFELRSLRQQPYDPNEQLQQAMQSAPMLIQPGGAMSELQPDADRSRRSVIARDTDGRILLIAVDAPIFTLSELAKALKDSDLKLDAALNLDGGRSTGLYLRTDVASVSVDSLERLPLVLTVQKL